MYKFSERSYGNLQGVRAELVVVTALALYKSAESEGPDFVVTEGLRSKEKQQEMVEQGLSKTLNSRHLTGHAIDIAAFDEHGNVTWDKEAYEELSTYFFEAAEELEVEVEWGGDWGWDFPHFALSWNAYPKEDEDD